MTEHLVPTRGVSSAEDGSSTAEMVDPKSRFEASLRTAMSFLIVFALYSGCCVTFSHLDQLATRVVLV